MQDDSNFMRDEEPVHMTKMKDAQTIDISSQKKAQVNIPDNKSSGTESISQDPISPKQGEPEDQIQSKDIESPKTDNKELWKDQSKPIDITEGQL